MRQACSAAMGIAPGRAVLLSAQVEGMIDVFDHPSEALRAIADDPDFTKNEGLWMAYVLGGYVVMANLGGGQRI